MARGVFDYRQKKDQLDEIVAWFQAGDIDFEQAAAKFSEAQKIVAELNSFLDDNKAKLDIVMKNGK